MAKVDPNIAAHLEWIGFVKPTGLVVSPPTLVRAGAILNRYDRDGQRLLRECVEQRAFGPGDSKLEPYLASFRIFAETVLDWNFSPKAFAGTEECPIPDELKVQLPMSSSIIQPHYAVRELDSIRNSTEYDGARWQLLVRMVNMGEDLDRVAKTGSGIDASPHGVLERLLRETGVTAGLLFNGTTLRLLSAPRRESSGWLDFRVSDMVQTAGRPISSAMRLLLRQPRLLTLPSQQRLTALLVDSRRFQNEVSESLSEQVLQALYELLRGFQAAHDASNGELLRDPLSNRPDDVYRALLTVILRIVFLLYAEERDILPHGNETFSRYYSIAGLYERLREDAAWYPDTMDQRFGAWSQLLVLFRMIHDGAQSGELALLARRGALFDPARFPFLESLQHDHGREPGLAETPLVPDGTIFRVLEKILVLNGERISYRALDVEHVGSVYETMMGFQLDTASGTSIAIKAAKRNGAPTTINLDQLIRQPPAVRAKWFRDCTDRPLTDKIGKAVREAETLDSMHSVLDALVDKSATPDLIQTGAMILQPSKERRRSGSHYTPRELTQPIVRQALEPVLERLRPKKGQSPKPAQILELRICDPAVGSGAFLVEACRQMAETLVEAWDAHGGAPSVATREEESNRARRIIARRCLYGVDRNPVAVDLAKLSLWLVTLAKNYPLTFVDHTIRHGDSLVGLTNQQIESFHWDASADRFQEGLETMKVREHLRKIKAGRLRIQQAAEDANDSEVRRSWQDTLRIIDKVRYFGDLVIVAFFRGKVKKERDEFRLEYARSILSSDSNEYQYHVAGFRKASPPLVQFHWEIEFAEVFDRINRGFDVVVGNPPFAGKNTLAAGNVFGYSEWLRTMHQESHGVSDLAAHFFRRAFTLIRSGGTFGLIATNTISQGETRYTGLRWICNNGGSIYNAIRRYKWPGSAAVVVSVVHTIKKQGPLTPPILDGIPVENITAFLFPGRKNDDPSVLRSNKNLSFQGDVVLGMGFTFDDQDKKGVAAPISERERLIAKSRRNAEIIAPYIGGKEVNSHPLQRYHRYVINFRNYPLMRSNLDETWKDADSDLRAIWLKDGIVPQDFEDPVASDWPDLLEVVEQRVRPVRTSLPATSSWNREFARRWWQFAIYRVHLREAISSLDRVLVIARISPNFAFSFLPQGYVYSDKLIIFAFDSYSAFCTLQSRVHEVWARFFGTSLKDDLSYANVSCFESFPFPVGWGDHYLLEGVGKECYEHRSHLMVQNNEGLTKTYNRFHDPNENGPAIDRLRKLHEAMDRAVLEAYGWADIPTDCEFLLDYEIEGGGGGRGLIVTAGQITSETMSSGACSNSMPNVPPKRRRLVLRPRGSVGAKRQAARHPQRLEDCFHDGGRDFGGTPMRDRFESGCASAPRRHELPVSGGLVQ